MSDTPLRFFLPSTGFQRDQFPGFISTMRVLRLPAAHPAALRFLRLAVPRFHSLRSLPGRRVGRRGLELVTRYLQPGVAEETTGSPKFLGNPDCPFAHVQSTPAGLLAPDHYDAAAWPLVCEKQRLPRKVFRRSIAWLSDSLSTLRRTGHPATTQDSLPAAGQALPDGLFTRKVPMKGFKVVNYISFPFPKLCLTQSHRPPALNGGPKCVRSFSPVRASLV